MIERWAQKSLWAAGILTVVCLGMLYWGASERALLWLLPVYLLVGMPIIVADFVGDLARVRSLWRSRKAGDDDE